MKKHVCALMFVALAALMIASLVSFGAAYARRLDEDDKTLGFDCGFSSGTIRLLDPTPDGEGNYKALSGWTSVSGEVSVIDFLLADFSDKADPAPFDQYAYITVFTSSGAEAGDISVSLEAPGFEVIPEVSACIPGSALYEQYGAGNIWRFRLADGSLASWYFRGGVASSVEMKLTVTGVGDLPAAVAVIADGVPASRG